MSHCRQASHERGGGGDIAPQGQREQQANNEDSALNDIPEWILEENIRLNRAITPPAGRAIHQRPGGTK